MSNIIDSIQLSGVTYDIGGSGGGNPTVELTQAQYDELVASGTVQNNTYYIITDASAGDLTQYWTSAQTNSAITEAVSGKASQTDLETVSGQVATVSGDVSTVSGQVANKQDTLVSGTNIKTINNQSLLGSGNIDIQGGGGGGGKAVSAGTNISITTGETADTINCTLPISADTNTIRINRKNIKIGTGNITTSNLDRVQVAIGDAVTANGIYSFAFGAFAKATNYNTVSMGHYTESDNQYQVSFGQYNESSSASTTFGDSGNTLFSVGNGTSSARHNAFEIRQNGDIYINDGTNDVKLQDTITATAANTTALGGLKLVKLSQSEYDSLSTKDNSTLYVIVN